MINNTFYKKIKISYINNCILANGIESYDIGADGKIGLAEVINILKSISEGRY